MKRLGRVILVGVGAGVLYALAPAVPVLTLVAILTPAWLGMIVASVIAERRDRSR